MQATRRISDREKKAKFIPHLQPLSVYSGVVNDDVDSFSPIPFLTSDDPFINFKVELVNTGSSASCKKQLEDSGLDETYENPLKKSCVAKCSSDLGYVLDSYNILKEVKNSTPKLSSSKALNKVNKKENRRDGICTRVDKVQKYNCSDETDGQSSVVVCGDHLISTTNVANNDMMDAHPEFCYEAESLSLSPVSQNEAGSVGLVDFLQSGQTFYKEQLSLSLDQYEGKECDEGYVTNSYRNESFQMSRDIECNYTNVCETASLNDQTPPVSQSISRLMPTQLVKQSPLLNSGQKPEEEQVSLILNHQPRKDSSVQTTRNCLELHKVSGSQQKVPNTSCKTSAQLVQVWNFKQLVFRMFLNYI